MNINAILDFQRRFLIRVEQTNNMPMLQQRWGLPFVALESGFDIYQPFIANQRKAAQIAQSVFDKMSIDPENIKRWGSSSSDKGKTSIVAAVAGSRDVCKLKYLTGAAPIVYGIPFYL